MERLTWKEIESKYPSRWIVMNNVKFNGGDIYEADVIDVLTDETISEYRISNIDKGYLYDRTNPEELGGFIGVILDGFSCTII